MRCVLLCAAIAFVAASGIVRRAPLELGFRPNSIPAE
jgi:hypothetical protein